MDSSSHPAHRDAAPPFAPAPAPPPDPCAPPPHRTYLDAAQVAPLHPAARAALLAAIDDGWADPRRLHREGRRARMLLDGARAALAGGLGARTEEVTFTGSHVEAVHAGICGVVAARRRTGPRVVLGAVEHSAVLNAARHAGEPVVVGVDPLGRVDAATFAENVAAHGVSLACLQSANGEVGTCQPVAEVAAGARARAVPLLVDAAASIGHAEPPPDWDLLTADPRAWGAPPGIGLLAIRAGARWAWPGPASDGTERVPGAVSVPIALAAAVALQAADADRAATARRHRELTARIRAAAAAISDTDVAGDPDDRLPHVVTFSCLFVDGEALVTELDRAGFAVGSGSACTAATLEPSHVLAAMGRLTHGNVRVGLSAEVTSSQVDAFCAVLPVAVRRIRALLGADNL